MKSLDAVVAAPKHHKVLLENDYIRVLETLIPPGEQTEIHTHVWGGYLYIVSWSDLVRYDDVGNILLDTRNSPNQPQPGTAIWAEPLGPHVASNVGDRNLHVILTELKSQLVLKK